MSPPDAVPGPGPLCFVLMPFGRKPDPAGGPPIDFDAVYTLAIAPAIADAGLEPVRADQELIGGIIHKPMFERLLLCQYAVADLTTANANVFYELGVRHAARPATTLTIFAARQPIPFDVNFLRSLPYALGDNNGFGPEQAAALRRQLGERLASLRARVMNQDEVDSPLFQLVTDWRPAPIARDKTDVFREQVRLDEDRKEALAEVRSLGRRGETRTEAHGRLARFRDALGPLDGVDTATVIDLMLTHRALDDWDGMIALHQSMPETLKRQVLVREQLAFAYNRRAGATRSESDRDRALQILSEVEAQQGPSSETCGLIGRIHKDRWRAAASSGAAAEARGHLGAAIEAYRRGYLADPRDAYPGINLLTLLEARGDAASLAERRRLQPVVAFAVQRRLQGKSPDYWDHATQLELAVLDSDRPGAEEALGRALPAVRETWEPRTTADNLGLIVEARAERGEDVAWLRDILGELERKAAG